MIAVIEDHREQVRFSLQGNGLDQAGQVIGSDGGSVVDVVDQTSIVQAEGVFSEARRRLNRSIIEKTERE